MKKGLGYMIEAIGALLVIFVFLITLAPEPEDINSQWVDERNEILASDISTVIKTSGEMNRFLANGNTGSISTLGNRLSNGEFNLNGGLTGLPIDEADVGWHVYDYYQQEIPTQQVEPSDECYYQLEEINKTHPDSPVLRSQNPSDGSYLYILDTDPDVPDGFDETKARPDYDTLWVDNGTRCQFRDTDGPFFEDDLFYWGDGSQGDYFEFKAVNQDEEIVINLANQPAKVKQQINREIDRVNVSVDFETFTLGSSKKDYDMVVYRGTQAIEDLQSTGNWDDYLGFLASGGSSILMADLEQDDVENRLSELDVNWVDVSAGPDAGNPRFGRNRAGLTMENYFEMMDGDVSNVDMDPFSRITSSYGKSLLDRQNAADSGKEFDLSEWGAEETLSLSSVKPLQNSPDSDCSGRYYVGDLTLQDLGSITVASTPVDTSGSAPCNGHWLASFDTDGDSVAEDEIGQVAEGEEFELGSRTYELDYDSSSSCDPGECVELEIAGENRLPLALVTAGLKQGGSGRVTFMPRVNSINEDEARMIGSAVLTTRTRSVEFGDRSDHGSVQTTTGTVGDQNPIPYTLSTRWVW